MKTTKKRFRRMTTIERVDGTGPITRMICAKQCNSKAIDRRCQGKHGHHGWHWCYSASGWFESWPSKRKSKGIAHSSAPPGHVNYPDPVKQQKLHYHAFTKFVTIQRRDV